MIFARAGAIVTCEDKGHELLRVLVDLDSAAPPRAFMFESICEAMPQPASHEVINPNCPICGATWFKSGAGGTAMMHFKEGWSHHLIAAGLIAYAKGETS
jgi:hypothetical protein